MLTAFGLFHKPVFIKERELTITSNLERTNSLLAKSRNKLPDLKGAKLDRELDWIDQTTATARSYQRRLNVIHFFWGK